MTMMIINICIDNFNVIIVDNIHHGCDEPNANVECRIVDCNQQEPPTVYWRIFELLLL